MITTIIYLITLAVLVGIVFIQVYNIKTLSECLEHYAYTCNKLSHENAELRKLLHK